MKNSKSKVCSKELKSSHGYVSLFIWHFHMHH